MGSLPLWQQRELDALLQDRAKRRYLLRKIRELRAAQLADQRGNLSAWLRPCPMGHEPGVCPLCGVPSTTGFPGRGTIPTYAALLGAIRDAAGDRTLTAPQALEWLRARADWVAEERDLQRMEENRALAQAAREERYGDG